MTSEQEANKFLGFYAEAHEALDAVAQEYNLLITIGGEFEFTDEMRNDVAELVAVATDFKARVHKQFLVAALSRAEKDVNSWKSELEQIDG